MMLASNHHHFDKVNNNLTASVAEQQQSINYGQTRSGFAATPSSSSLDYLYQAISLIEQSKIGSTQETTTTTSTNNTGI